MKKNILLNLISLFFLAQASSAQSPIVNPKSNSLTVKKIVGTDLLVHIELDFVNPTGSGLNPTITIQLDNTTAPVVSQFASLMNISIINNNQTFSIGANKTAKATENFYLFIDKTVVITTEKILYLNIKEGASTLSVIKVIIQPDDKSLSLDEYMENDKKPKNRTNMLGYVTKVESANNVLTISGYKEVKAHDGTKHDVFLKKTVELKRGEVLSVKEWSWVRNPWHWKPVPISLTTIPFKIRPGITWNDKEYKVSSTSGISNIGFNLDLVKWQMDRYFSAGKKSTHKFSFGLWGAPSVEELDSLSTTGAGDALGKLPGKMEKSKQLFISTGLTLSYSYNDISFVFVPAGYDFATSDIGKHWIYKKRRWWGFGIAISPKIFATVFNSK